MQHWQNIYCSSCYCLPEQHLYFSPHKSEQKSFSHVLFTLTFSHANVVALCESLMLFGGTFWVCIWRTVLCQAGVKPHTCHQIDLHIQKSEQRWLVKMFLFFYRVINRIQLQNNYITSRHNLELICGTVPISLLGQTGREYVPLWNQWASGLSQTLTHTSH